MCWPWWYNRSVDTDPNAAFSANMRAARDALRLSRAALGERLAKLGLDWGSHTQTTIGRIEAGQRRVDLSEAHIIARALDTTVQALTTGQSTDADAVAAEQIQRAIEAVESATDELHRSKQYLENYRANSSTTSLPDGPL